MKKSDFQVLVNQLAALSVEQREAVREQLAQLSSKDGVAELAAIFSAWCTSCPHCGGTQLYRHGQALGLPRSRCRACHKTFNPLSGTPLAHLRLRHKWLSYHQCLFDSLAIRKSATTVDISRNTSFRWRHRFLDWVKNDLPERLHGIAEADEMYLLESGKRRTTFAANCANTRWCCHLARYVEEAGLRSGSARQDWTDTQLRHRSRSGQ
jgi:transposase-like protein